jgi:5'-nucleotidase
MGLLFKSIQSSRHNKIVFTVSIGAICGISIAANYYLRLLSIRKKRVANKSTLILEMIPELMTSNVRIKNPTKVEQLLSNIINAGKQRLQVISDFDRTISLVSFEGKSCPTSIGVLESSQFVTPELRAQFKALRDHYLPIEHDPNMSRDAKLPLMLEWWQKSFELIVDTGITQQNVVDIVRHSNNHLKEGCLWFFYTLERCDVPLLIFSAGLGDMIQEWMLQDCGNFKNIKIVSNFMRFNNSDEEKRINGFLNETIIHIFNKNESVLLGDESSEKLIRDRPNVILIGDSLGDVDMAAGFESNNILKIGFLNEHCEQLLPSYMDVYDIVTIKDSTFNVPNAVIKSIV